LSGAHHIDYEHDYDHDYDNDNDNDNDSDPCSGRAVDNHVSLV